MFLPFLDISSQLVPHPVVQMGLNAHVVGWTEGCRCAPGQLGEVYT